MGRHDTSGHDDWYFEHDQMPRDPIIVEDDDTNTVAPVEPRRYERVSVWEPRPRESNLSAEPPRPLNDSVQPLGD